MPCSVISSVLFFFLCASRLTLSGQWRPCFGWSNCLAVLQMCGSSAISKYSGYTGWGINQFKLDHTQNSTHHSWWMAKKKKILCQYLKIYHQIVGRRGRWVSWRVVCVLTCTIRVWFHTLHLRFKQRPPTMESTTNLQTSGGFLNTAQFGWLCWWIWFLYLKLLRKLLSFSQSYRHGIRFTLLSERKSQNLTILGFIFAISHHQTNKYWWV